MFKLFLLACLLAGAAFGLCHISAPRHMQEKRVDGPRCIPVPNKPCPSVFHVSGSLAS